MMICNRCGSRCPPRESGYCLHCQIAVDIEEGIGKSLKEAGVDEGFPDWEKPKKGDSPRKDMLL